MQAHNDSPREEGSPSMHIKVRNGEDLRRFDAKIGNFRQLVRATPYLTEISSAALQQMLPALPACPAAAACRHACWREPSMFCTQAARWHPR